MKILYTILFLIFGNIAEAQAFIDFSGSWIGSCLVNGSTEASRKNILQTQDKSIEINGMTFDLTKPTVTSLDDIDEGDLYREITVYDWQWDADKKSIVTSANWLGWYLERPGSWSGKGVGIIKIEKEQLITTRKFGNVDESCVYSLEVKSK